MEESLRWGWSYYVSKREIEKMRKNMKKVPIIQKKSELYHKNQDQEAELFIDDSLKNAIIIDNKVWGDNNIENYWNNAWLRNNIISKIKNLLFKKHNGD